MENVTVYNMPENRLYQFDSDKYVWRTQLYSTRRGNYPAREPISLTEVYQKDDNYLRCIASGRIINNKYTNTDYEFTIFDYDVDTSIRFKIEMPLKEADKETYMMLRDNITEVMNTRSK